VWYKIYAKFVVASIAALGVAGSLLVDGRLTAAEAVAVVLAGLGALGVRKASNA